MSKKCKQTRLLSKEDENKYAGQHVVISNYKSKVVITADPDPIKAYADAVEKGHTNPVIFYVPRKNETFIFGKITQTPLLINQPI